MNNVAGNLIAQAQSRSGLSLREVARRAGTSHATLHTYIKGTKCPSTETLIRIIEGCGFALDFTLRPRVREQDGLARGEELVEALRLAEQFPGRSTRKSNYPKFPSLPDADRGSG